MLDSLNTVMSHEMSANAKVEMKDFDIQYPNQEAKADSQEKEKDYADGGGPPRKISSVNNNDKPAKGGVFNFDNFIFTLEPGKYAFLEI